MDIDPNTLVSKQIKLETIITIENKNNYDSELHSELIINEKYSADPETNVITQSPTEDPPVPIPLTHNTHTPHRSKQKHYKNLLPETYMKVSYS